MPITHISVRGARQHNLRDINVRIPRNTLTVVTGLSGSGKSSLAFDTIYAEGQRRYVETLSAYARQFLDQIERPDVDSIEGLSPAISIEQKTTSRSPRSTVGTITEIYDYLRLLYASVGTPHCPNCGRPISRQSADQIVQRILELGAGERVTVMAPVVRGRKGEFKDLLDQLDRQGFRARVDGEVMDLSEPVLLDRRKNHAIEAVIDRILLKNPPADAPPLPAGKPSIEKRLEAAVAKALQLANGLVLAAITGGSGPQEQLFSSSMACPDCGLDVPKLEPRSFSFNSAFGACPECHGLGSLYDLDPAKVITDWSKPLLDGGLGPGSSSQYLLRLLNLAADRYKIDLKTPFEELPPRQQHLLVYGPPKGEAPRTGFHGILSFLRDSIEEAHSDAYRESMMAYMSATPCPVCRGKRLRPESLAVKIGGLSIADFTALPLNRALSAAINLKFTARELLVAERIRREIAERLEFLCAVGLTYLSLDRNAATLSGGEGQRIRLATQIGSKLRGVLYVLDEPSIGLHQRDNNRLIEALEKLRDLGNTVLVVEHDEETIRHADYVLDLGPGAGRLGGQVVAQGTPAEIMACPESLTGRYLSGVSEMLQRTHPRRLTGKWLTVTGAREHNLQDINIRIPLGVMTVVTGVSGSGKSTLINDILYRSLAQTIYGSREDPGAHESLTGAEQLDKVVRIDQSPIGRTPRSNPATYTQVFAPIRDLFSMLPEARERGYKAGRFSFNVTGGRCETCQGDGQRRIEMNFMPDVYVQCEVCNGRRYNQETLTVKFKGHSIADILDLTIEDALTVLADVPQVRQKLQTLVDVGLGYVHLGQSATTLSGGEAQRMKLARELSKRQTGRTLYLLDEPTTGLHFDDVRKLLEVLHRLTDLGNSVIIIEHNLDVIRNADWILDLGPEGGEDGGRIVGEGRPAKIAATPGSYTGEFLKRYYTSANGHLEEAEPEPTSDLGAPSIPQLSAEWVGDHEPQPASGKSKLNGNASRKGTAGEKTAKEEIRTSQKEDGVAMSDLDFTPHDTEQEPLLAPEQTLPQVVQDADAPAELFQSWSQPEVVLPVRTPHLGHLALLAAFLLLGFLCMTVSILIGVYFHLDGVTAMDGIKTNVHYILGGEAILYIVTLALSFIIFPLIWKQSFLAGIQWRGATAQRLRWWLFGVAAACIVLAMLDDWLMPGPKNAPIDDMFRSPGAAWLMFGFGITFAPFFEEIAFRGFLLPALATAWDWSIEKSTGKPARPLDANEHPEWSISAMVAASIATSLPFALMHAEQTGWSWGPFVLLMSVSLILCAVRLKTRSLACSTLVHACYNFIIFSFALISSGGFRHLDKM